MANPIIAMPGRGSDGRECVGYGRLYILRGKGPRNPRMAYDARARDDEPDEPVSNIGGNQTEAICSWCRDNLNPQQIDELVDALMALQSQSMDEAGPESFPGKPKPGGGMVSIAGDDRLTFRAHDGRSEAEKEFARRWPEAARIKFS